MTEALVNERYVLRGEGTLVGARSGHRFAALWAAVERGDAETAFRVADAAIDGGRTSPDVCAALTQLLDGMGENDRMEALKELGAGAFKRADYDAARYWFRAAVDLRPTQAWRWVWLSRAQHKLAELEDALACAHRALECQPDWPPALWQVIDVQEARDEAGEALETLDRLLALPDLETDQLRKAMRWLYQRKEWVRALATAERLLRVEPTDEDGLSIEAVAAWRLGDQARAIEIASRLKGTSAARVAAQLYLEGGSPLAAWRAVQGLDGPTGDPRFLVAIGHGLRRVGYVDLAVDAYEAALARAPDDSVVTYAHAAGVGERRVLDGSWRPRRRPLQALAPEPGRVLHVVGRSFPYTQTGYTVRTHYVLRAQRGMGLDARGVTELGFPWDDGVRADRTTERVDGVPYHRLRHRLGRLPLDVRLDRAVGALVALARRLRPAALHAASDYRNAVVALEAGRLTGLPVVYEVRGFWEETRLGRQGRGAEERECYRWHRDRELDCMLAADHVVTLAEVMKEQLVQRGVPAEQVTVVPNGVDPAVFRPVEPSPELRTRLGIAEGEVVLGYISSFTPYEGIQYLIEGVQRLAADGFPVRALLVGDGTERAFLEAEAARLGVTDRVVFTGRVPHAEILDYYALIDVFVVPRTDDTVSHLVTPLKPFEAMATGRAMVVSDVGALREVVRGGTGLTFRPEDPDDLAAVVAPLVADRDARTALGEAARAWVCGHHTWQANGERYRELYRSLGAL
jgi:PEP-CTERM/exosortase A-associated glycosyltransferase